MTDIKQGFFETKTPAADATANRLTRDVVGNKEDAAAVTVGTTTSLVAYLKGLIGLVGAAQLRTSQSASGPVEEDAIMNFSIGIFDVDGGAIATGDIDISGISNVLSKSTDGGAFSAAGITQPTFLEEAGRVYCNYRFLDAQWKVGDVYRLIVTGITATVNAQTIYVPTMVWSNMVFEAADIRTEVDGIVTDIGDPSGQTLTSLTTKWGDIARSLDLLLGARWDSSGDLGTDIAAIITDIGDPSGHTLTSLTAKWGDIARTLDLILGARWDSAGDLGTDIAAIIGHVENIDGATGILHEQADAPVDLAVGTAEANIFDLTVAATRYLVRNLRVKSADPTGSETVTIRLYELINDAEVLIDSFTIDTNNYTTYFSLMDMFGVPSLAGDNIRVCAIGSAVGPIALTGQYQHAKTNV